MGRSQACFAVIVMALAAPLVGARTASPTMPAPIRKIFISRCTGCHAGASPAAGMSLDPDRLPASIQDKPSSGKPDLKIFDSATPEKSYILMKLRGAAGIAGSRMPLRAKKLSEADIQTIADWLAGIKPRDAAAAEVKKSPTNRPAEA